MNGVAATVAGIPVAVAEVDEREAALRAARLSAALPRPGTSEGRQLRRWLTQLLVTERVIAVEAATLGIDASGPPSEEELLPDTAARLEIGSVAASALADPLARALYVHVTADVEVGNDDVVAYQARNPLRFSSNREVEDHLRAAACRRAFRIWLDSRRAALVSLAPGYEHPGDPRQPDNTHRH